MKRHQIPTEVLSQIFFLCLPELPPLSPPPLQPLSSIKELPLPQHKLLSSHTQRPPISFGQVCRHWRYVAYSSARLWTQLDLPICIQDSRPIIKALLEWLSRSAGCPLTLSIAFYTPRVDNLQSIVDVVTPHYSRLKHLELYAPRTILQPFITAVFHTESGLPLLRSLHLSTCPVNAKPHEDPIELEILPQLTNLSLRGVFKIKLPTIPQSNLRILCLDIKLSSSEFLDCMGICPSVEELSVLFNPTNTVIIGHGLFGEWVEWGDGTAKKIVTLPRLRKLHMGLYFFRLGSALDSLSLPSLQHLALGPANTCLQESGWNNISSMLKRSNANLISLHIEGRHFVPHLEWVSCLKLCPNLKRLSGNCSLWMRDISTFDIAVPLLEEITVYGFQDLVITKMARVLLSCLSAFITFCQGRTQALAPQQELARLRVTFECRDCHKDIVLSNSEFKNLISQGLDVQFCYVMHPPEYIYK